MRIAINGNRHQEGHLESIRLLTERLLRRGDHVVMSEPLLRYLTGLLGDRFALGIDYLPLSRQPQADMALSIGGDGAFLKTAAWIGDSETPIAGINTGHLGYLTDFSFAEPETLEAAIFEGKFDVQERSLIAAQIPEGISITSIKGREAAPHTLYALNEAAILRGDSANMLTASISLGTQEPLPYLGDGVIISTPTGSTAYNLSVGGPILDPTLRAVVVAPVAAHSLSVRPIVASDNIDITVDVSLRASHFLLVIDGRSYSVEAPARLTLRRAPFTVLMVRAPGHSFTRALRLKLGLNS